MRKGGEPPISTVDDSVILLKSPRSRWRRHPGRTSEAVREAPAAGEPATPIRLRRAGHAAAHARRLEIPDVALMVGAGGQIDASRGRLSSKSDSRLLFDDRTGSVTVCGRGRVARRLRRCWRRKRRSGTALPMAAEPHRTGSADLVQSGGGAGIDDSAYFTTLECRASGPDIHRRRHAGRQAWHHQEKLVRQLWGDRHVVGDGSPCGEAYDIVGIVGPPVTRAADAWAVPRYTAVRVRTAPERCRSSWRRTSRGLFTRIRQEVDTSPQCTRARGIRADDVSSGRQGDARVRCEDPVAIGILTENGIFGVSHRDQRRGRNGLRMALGASK